MSARTLTALVIALACEAAASQSAGIQRAARLQGCWEMSTPGRSVEEIWTTPKGGSMIGVSRTIRDGKLAEYEMILLREAQQVGYRIDGEALLAWVSRSRNGKVRRIEFPYKRVRCAAP